MTAKELQLSVRDAVARQEGEQLVAEEVRHLVLRTWATDPELCWQCGKTMVRSRVLVERQELLRLLKNLKLGNYPSRPRSPPPPEEPDSLLDSEFRDDTTQLPPGWEDLEAA